MLILTSHSTTKVNIRIALDAVHKKALSSLFPFSDRASYCEQVKWNSDRLWNK